MQQGPPYYSEKQITAIEAKLRKIKIFILVVFLIAANSFPLEQGCLAIHSVIYPLTFLDVSIGSYSGTLNAKPACKFGLDYYPIKRLGINVDFGIVYISGNEMDSNAQTQPNPSYQLIETDLGFAYKAFQSGNSALNIIGTGGLRFMTWYDYVASTTPLSTVLLYNYVYYTTISPWVLIGFEPTYFLSKNISLYTNFGLEITFTPNSRYIDHNDPQYNLSAGIFPLKEKQDGQTIVATNGLNIGLRYHF